MRAHRWSIPGGGGLALVLAERASGAREGRPGSHALLGYLLDAAPARALVAELGVVLGGSLAEDQSGLRRRVQAALESGRVCVVRGLDRERSVGGAAAREEAEEQALAPPPPSEVKTWITIRLVDDSDPPRAIAGARYRIKLPDGTVREGRLDASGIAHHGGLDPGTCEVSFPEYDRASWSKVG